MRRRSHSQSHIILWFTSSNFHLRSRRIPLPFRVTSLDFYRRSRCALCELKRDAVVLRRQSTVIGSLDRLQLRFTRYFRRKVLYFYSTDYDYCLRSNHLERDPLFVLDRYAEGLKDIVVFKKSIPSIHWYPNKRCVFQHFFAVLLNLSTNQPSKVSTDAIQLIETCEHFKFIYNK